MNRYQHECRLSWRIQSTKWHFELNTLIVTAGADLNQASSQQTNHH